MVIDIDGPKITFKVEEMDLEPGEAAGFTREFADRRESDRSQLMLPNAAVKVDDAWPVDVRK